MLIKVGLVLYLEIDGTCAHFSLYEAELVHMHFLRKIVRFDD